MDIKSHWLDEYQPADNLQILEELSLSHAREGGVQGHVIYKLIRARMYYALCNFELDMSQQIEPEQLYHCCQALAFFKKNASLDIGVNKRRVAYEKFVESESKCAVTNDIFFRHLAGNFSFLPADCRVLYAVRRKIGAVLGVCPPLRDVRYRFGPGATTLTKKIESCPSTKMAHGLACSRNLHTSGLLPEILRCVPHWTDQFSETKVLEDGSEAWVADVILTDGRLGFVPKNAKTDRGTVTEPSLNMMFQLGYGDVIARRLRKHGIDTRDQTLNQRLAREGSLTNELATLDLSSASDLVSRGLVKFLLPDDWYFMLNALRSDQVRWGKRTLCLNKFSSMGNGFTFPLETLIFWSIAYTVCGNNVSAFGDDIICPSNRAEEVVRVLGLCGFSVNPEKSFIRGPFRESCGHDYYLGTDIRPYFQDSGITAQSLFVLHNFYVRHGDVRRAERVRRLIHPGLRLYGPDGYGDGHLLGDHPRVTPSKLKRKGFGGYKFDTWSLVPRKRYPRYPGDYISPLYHVYMRGDAVDPMLGIDLKASTSPVEFTKSGYPLWPLPDGEVVRRLSVYTLG